MAGSWALVLCLVATSSAFAQKKPPARELTPPSGQLNKDEIRTQIAEGRRLLAGGATSKAAALFRELVARVPGNAIAQNELGVTLFQQGATEASIEPFSRAVKLDKKLAHAWANLAEAQRLSGRFKKAALSYHRFLQLHKGDRYAIYGLALCFEGYDAFSKALKTLSVAERAARDDARLLSRVTVARRRVRLKIADARLPIMERGDAHLIAGRWKEALAMYEKGLAGKVKLKTPSHAKLLGRRGLVKAIMGDLPGARGDLEASLLADPTGHAARAAYSLVLDATGQTAGDTTSAKDAAGLLAADRAALAHKAYELTLADTPDASAALVGRGEASLRMGRIESALMDFTAAKEGDGAAAGRAEAHLVLGAEANAKEAAATAKINVPLADLPLWRRSLLSR